MARTTAYRKYQLTINNPLDHGFSHDVLKTTIADFSNCIYWCMCDEVGVEGTPHTHLYLAFRNPVEFSSIHQRFYGAHIEGAKGTHQDNRDYIRKEGHWLYDEKHDTNIPETFEESGELPPERNKNQSQSEQILAMIETGASNSEIIRSFPTWMKHMRSLNSTRQELLSEKYRTEFRELSVYYLWGKTGVGKTRSIMEKYGYENVYQITNYAHPFDSYRQEPVILFDEFRSDLPLKDMLKYLDGYPILLPCRYEDRVAAFTEVYIVSNIPIEKQYPNIQIDEPESWKAFLRRINGGIFEMLDPSSKVPFEEDEYV